MPWVIGIDEAGYGPNLGPFVQAAVSLKLPDGDGAGWKTLRSAVRRCRQKADGRLLLDDSKQVYTRGGLTALEHGVRAALPVCDGTVGDLVRAIGLPGVSADLADESWYDDGEAVPVEAPSDGVRTARERFANDLPQGVTFGTPAAFVVPTPRFNRLCDDGGTKAAVPGRGLAELIPTALAALPVDGEAVAIQCDKLGGRNYYAAIVQEALPSGWVVVLKESDEESRYRVDLLDRAVTVVFRPRADGDSLAVAVASMVCKYLREVCMRQFNRYWLGRVPGLKPTAGYPDDAKRFYAAILPALDALCLHPDRVWRKR